jgi:hypothetical protein
MAGFRDRVGRFRWRQAPETVEAAETIGPDELAAVEDVLEDVLDPVPQTPEAIGAELADVRRLLAEARARREALLLAGDIVGLGLLDQEIKRLETAFESYAVRQQAAYEAQAEAAQNRRAQEWARLKPELERAQSTVARLSFEMFAAVDRLRQVEGAAAAIGVAVANTPDALYVNGWWLQQRAIEHARAIGAMQPATAA